MRFFLFCFLLWIPFAVSAEEIVVSKELLLETAARLLHSQPQFLIQESYAAGPTDTRLFRNKMECGQGTCSQTVFLQQPGKSFYRWVGQIEGQLTKVSSEPKSQAPVFITRLQLGSDQNEKATWIFNSTKNIYEAQ
jgi:hypothetical protein